jgi:hypothetical protein
MFCPKCGADHQVPESYCRSCGEWLPDLDYKTSRLRLGTSTRKEKVTRIRTLELISAGLSLTAAAIIFSFLFTGANQGLLFLAAAVTIVVAVYQIANMFLGYSVMKGLPKPPGERQRQFERPRETALPAPNTNDLRVPASVTENTTTKLNKAEAKNRQ